MGTLEYWVLIATLIYVPLSLGIGWTMHRSHRRELQNLERRWGRDTWDYYRRGYNKGLERGRVLERRQPMIDDAIRNGLLTQDDVDELSSTELL